ncbi:MAG: hypothetical protein U0V75_15660 [Ferruginibacter sp.]
MRYLEKTWVRILASLLAGGFAQELFHISTGDPNRPEPPGVSPVFLGAAVFMFFVLTMFVRIKK